MRFLSFGILVLTLMLAIFIPSSTISAQASACDGLVPARLNIGATARVVYNGDGLGTEVRDNPGNELSGSRFIRAVPEGTVFTLLEGPICLDGAVWWRASLPEGIDVWVAEGDSRGYFLEPFILGAEILRPDANNPQLLNRNFVTYSGEVTPLPPFEIPESEAAPARDIWQQPDIDAANVELANRRSQCPQVLEGTPWQGVSDAGDVLVAEADYEYIPAPDGKRAFLIRHWVVQLPTCGGAPGSYYGISKTYLLGENRLTEFFPYGQHTPTSSRVACMSPDVSNASWATHLSEIVWSPDADTVALVARYLETGADQRLCAYYFIFLVDIFNGQVSAITEGRHVFWGGGGSRLYYVKFLVDNTSYNIQQEQLMVLSNGQSTPVNIPQISGEGGVSGGAQFVPSAFNSVGVMLPASSSGTQVLVCNTLSGCPETLEFDVTRNAFSNTPMELPDGLLPRQIAEVHYVLDDTRLLWLTTDGKVYIQSLRDPNIGVWVLISLDSVAAPETQVTDIILLPTGLSAVLELNTGDYVLLNTLSREVQLLAFNP